MQFVEQILYRYITFADFTNIEHVKKPAGGGGQTYIDISGLDRAAVVEFFKNSEASIDNEYSKVDNEGLEWPAFTAQVTPVGMNHTDLLEIDGRSAGNGSIRNYRIKNQAPHQHRHLAWRKENGFPSIIGDRFKPANKYEDAVLHPYVDPCIENLAVVLIKTWSGKIYSTWTQMDSLPENWPKNVGLEVLAGGNGSGCFKPKAPLALTNDKANPFGKVSQYDKQQFLNEVFLEEEDYETMTRLLKRKKNLILQGSPGTGKTFAAKRLAYSLMGATMENCVCSVQFHQNSSYEDYVIGFRPNEDTGEFELQLGKFIEFFDLADKYREQDFYLIIDEINRANVSKVFGELLMLIEADHRDERISFPASKSRTFSVPSNVFIIGMMNTADRGLALIDYALRRRFAFVELEPALHNESFRRMISDAKCKELSKLVDVTDELNNQIKHDASLGSGFRIGHSYFCLKPPVTKEDVRSVIYYELVPLVQEYWFDQESVATDAIELLESAME